MDNNEKLELFHKAVLETAGKKSEAMLEEYKKNYQESLEEYEKQKIREQSTEERIEEEQIRKEVNRGISEQTLLFKKEYHKVEEEKKKILFARVEQLLKEYQRTGEYEAYLEQKIKNAVRFARGEEVTIYLNETDAALKERLEEKTACTLTMSQMDFMGGIRAVIRSKNILIDESFTSKIRNEWENYSF